MADSPDIRTITTQLPGRCLSCEGPVAQGEKVNWCPGIGVWHKTCERPKNLDRYWKDSQKKSPFDSNSTLG